MKHFGWRCLVASSLLLAAVAGAETRPQYGGTLHVAMREMPTSLDPADSSQTDSIARRNLIALICETLVTVDDRGRVHPWLAVDWQAGPGNQRWQFRLRKDVTFHDGSKLTAEIAASSLRAANPAWKVFADGDFVVIERDHSDAHLLSELALARNSIVKKRVDGKVSGTGPFHIEEWILGKKLTLGVEESYWRGRTFVDAIEIEMGENLHEQAVELDLAKADVIEISPEQAHRAAMEGRRVSSSQPMELVALVFNSDAQTVEEKMLRSALAHSVERNSMRSVLLQGAGQMAGGLLPNWMTGYAFTFSSDADLTQARHEREQSRTTSNWTVGYDANDSVARLMVERASLNTKDAGLTLRPTTATGADIQLVRIPLASADPWIALANLAELTQMTMPNAKEDSVEDLYEAERTMMAEQKVIPLFHLPVDYASSSIVKGWRPSEDGSWRLADTWMGKQKQ